MFMISVSVVCFLGIISCYDRFLTCITTVYRSTNRSRKVLNARSKFTSKIDCFTYKSHVRLSPCYLFGKWLVVPQMSQYCSHVPPCSYT